MSRIPDELPELGATALAFSHTPGFDPIAASITSEEYFVMSRCDGRTPTRDLILMTGFPTERAIAILRRLRSVGAIHFPGEDPAEVLAMAAARAAPVATAAEVDVTRPIAVGTAAGTSDDEPVAVAPDNLTPEEEASLRADCVLTEAERIRVLVMRRRIRKDHFSALGVSRDVDTKTLKRTYFKLSKQFHPDRYYGKNLGAYDEWLHEVFESISSSFQILVDTSERNRYLRALDGDSNQPPPTQTREEYAAELFERACHAEVTGHPAEAMELFSACVRVHPLSKYLTRAARCGVRAGNGVAAVQFARQATALEPQNPSVHRILADAERLAGDLDAAEATLLLALGLKSENDHLTEELRHDLATVRQQRDGGAGRR